MCAMIRYVFPSIEPYDLAPDDMARLWREAQFIINTFRLITKNE